MSSDSSPSLEQMRSHRSILLSSHDIVDQDKNPQSIHGTFSHLLQRSRNAIFKQKIRCDGRLTLSGRVESTENDVHDRSLSTAPWEWGPQPMSCHGWLWMRRRCNGRERNVPYLLFSFTLPRTTWEIEELLHIFHSWYAEARVGAAVVHMEKLLCILWFHFGTFALGTRNLKEKLKCLLWQSWEAAKVDKTLPIYYELIWEQCVLLNFIIHYWSRQLSV